jgi:hypothetical protein
MAVESENVSSPHLGKKTSAGTIETRQGELIASALEARLGSEELPHAEFAMSGSCANPIHR